MDAIVIERPEKQLEQRALATLADITRYVTVNRFSLWGLAHGLGRRGRADELQSDLIWLVKEGYMHRDVSQIYSITLKGRRYEPSEPYDDESSPVIEFVSTSEPEPPARPDPRNRRR